VVKQFVLTVVTHPTKIVRSQRQTVMRTPGDAVVLIQRVAQQRVARRER